MEFSNHCLTQQWIEIIHFKRKLKNYLKYLNWIFPLNFIEIFPHLSSFGFLAHREKDMGDLLPSPPSPSIGCNIWEFKEQIKCAIKKTDYSSELHCTEDSLEISEHVTVTCHQPTSSEIEMIPVSQYNIIKYNMQITLFIAKANFTLLQSTKWKFTTKIFILGLLLTIRCWYFFLTDK